jgi:hypothetical protein
MDAPPISTSKTSGSFSIAYSVVAGARILSGCLGLSITSSSAGSLAAPRRGGWRWLAFHCRQYDSVVRDVAARPARTSRWRNAEANFEAVVGHINKHRAIFCRTWRPTVRFAIKHPEQIGALVLGMP